MEKINQFISLNLKEFRKKNGLSLDQTSHLTGVSKAMLGQIERGESSPTISTLWKIAKGLQIPFSSFFEKYDREVKNANNSLAFSSDIYSIAEKIRVTTVFPYEDKTRCEIFLLELQPGCNHLSKPHQQGTVEYVIGIDGEIEVLIDNIWHIVSRGTGIRLNADEPHGYRNSTSHWGSFYNIIHYPEF